jgi:hypothetical protein
VQRFVDRIEPRRQLFSKLQAGAKAVAVVGGPENGKSWFLRSCLRCLAWAGHAVIYINLKKHANWKTLLAAIAAGGDEPPLTMALSAVERERLAASVQTNLEGGGTFPIAIEHTLQAIRPAVDERPLVLILDHLETSDSQVSIASDTANICNYFFNYLANADGRVRLILSCVAPSALSHLPAGAPPPINLTPFPADEVPELLREWFQAADLDMDKAERFIGGLSQTRSPREFTVLCEALAPALGKTP